jgi:uncharacterized protein (UPF0261 family)
MKYMKTHQVLPNQPLYPLFPPPFIRVLIQQPSQRPPGHVDVAATGPKVKLHQCAIGLSEHHDIVADAEIADSFSNGAREAVEEASSQFFKALDQDKDVKAVPVGGGGGGGT